MTTTTEAPTYTIRTDTPVDGPGARRLYVTDAFSQRQLVGTVVEILTAAGSWFHTWQDGASRDVRGALLNPEVDEGDRVLAVTVEDVPNAEGKPGTVIRGGSDGDAIEVRFDQRWCDEDGGYNDDNSWYVADWVRIEDTPAPGEFVYEGDDFDPVNPDNNGEGLDNFERARDFTGERRGYRIGQHVRIRDTFFDCADHDGRLIIIGIEPDDAPGEEFRVWCRADQTDHWLRSHQITPVRATTFTPGGTMPTTTFPITAADWTDRWDNDGMPRWGCRTEIGEVMSTLLTEFTTEQMVAATDEQIMVAFKRAVDATADAFYTRGAVDDQRILGWLRPIMAEYLNTPQTAVDHPEIVVDWDAILPIHWSGWDEMHPLTRGRMKAMCEWALERWTAKPASRPSDGYTAYLKMNKHERSMPVTTDESNQGIYSGMSESYNHQIEHVGYALIVGHYINGAPMPKRPLPTGDAAYKEALEDMGIEAPNTYWAKAIRMRATDYRVRRLPITDDQMWDEIWSYPNSYGYPIPHEHRDLFLQVTKAFVNDEPLPTLAPPDGFTDADAFDTLLSFRTRTPWRESCVGRALDEYRDAVAAGEITEPSAEQFRRMVRSWGDTRWTGGSRGVLEGLLRVVIDAHTGRTLTAEEWRARYERREMQVAHVAGRYGEQHSLCAQLEAALKELGMGTERMKAPNKVVRFKSQQGLIVQVPVATWRDDDGNLINFARAAWDKMSAEERENAVVDKGAVHVPWGEMTVG